MSACVCEACISTAEIDGRCDFCFAHCVDARDYSRQHERALIGILSWRAHVVHDALEEEGLDAVTWWPRVLAHGGLERALRAQEEHRALDRAYSRAVTVHPAARTPMSPYSAPRHECGRC